MYNFRNDYADGAHPAVLQKLVETNKVWQPGYGEDDYTLEAKHVLRNIMQAPDAEIHFVSGGTVANIVVISAMLKPYEAVVSSSTGHIFANEAGAIEASGHKVIAMETTDGKLTTAHIKRALKANTMKPHRVKIRMVYISNATETGTIYTKKELQALSEFCRIESLLLFLDGARLGYALMAQSNDLALSDIARLTDAFYIGGTKNGALLGEAIVITNLLNDSEFDYIIKQKGALLAKSRLLGIQFLELFKDDLYFNLAAHGNAMAIRMALAIEECGFSFLTKACTNQIFPILPHGVIKELSKSYLFYVWKEIDEKHSAIRLITSWATTEEPVHKFINDLRAANNENLYL